MPDIYKVAKLNINGFASQLKMRCSKNFCVNKRQIFLFPQEVKPPTFDNMSGYTSYSFIGMNRRGTANMAREHLPLTPTVFRPHGRRFATRFQGVRLVNIYNPSGIERR
jgi:exonuclease III